MRYSSSIRVATMHSNSSDAATAAAPLVGECVPVVLVVLVVVVVAIVIVGI